MGRFHLQPAPRLWHPSVDLQLWESSSMVSPRRDALVNRTPSPSPRLCLPLDKIVDEAQAKEFLSEYNSTAEVVWNAYTEASWEYNTNITDHNKEVMVWKQPWDCVGKSMREVTGMLAVVA